jgi:phosphoribosyl 1,2-cyclic phosphodiesterase
MTDTGCFLEENLPYIKNPTYLIIESNHDIKMLLNTKRTYELKNRILSDVGHLCNEDSAIAACEIIGKDTKEIILAHLSEEANTPECALAAYEKVFNHFGKDIKKYNVRCANQHYSLIGGNLDED